MIFLSRQPRVPLGISCANLAPEQCSGRHCYQCKIRHSHYEKPFCSAMQGILLQSEASSAPKKVISSFLRSADIFYYGKRKEFDQTYWLFLVKKREEAFFQEKTSIKSARMGCLKHSSKKMIFRFICVCMVKSTITSNALRIYIKRIWIWLHYTNQPNRERLNKHSI